MPDDEYQCEESDPELDETQEECPRDLKQDVEAPDCGMVQGSKDPYAYDPHAAYKQVNDS